MEKRPASEFGDVTRTRGVVRIDWEENTIPSTKLRSLGRVRKRGGSEVKA